MTTRLLIVSESDFINHFHTVRLIVFDSEITDACLRDCWCSPPVWKTNEKAVDAPAGLGRTLTGGAVTTPQLPELPGR